MTPERWARIKALFETALDQEWSDRDAFIAQACGADDDLRIHVGQLLAQHDNAAEFLESPIVRAGELILASPPAVSPLTAFPLTAPDFIPQSRFEVRNVLGSGAFGVVYRVWDRVRRKEVALKRLHRQDPDALYRFKREFRSLVDIRHEHLIRLYELFSENETWYFTMELIEGQTFLDYVRPDGSSYDETRLRDALIQLLNGVIALHGAKYLHRDLKPANVLVTTTGRVVILDFGIVHALTPSGADVTNTNIGTAAYMPPERFGDGSLSESSDAYAVGAMLFEALTGLPPRGRSLLDVLANLAASPDPQQIDPSLPQDLSTRCRELLLPDPRARPTLKTVLTGMEAVAVNLPDSVLEVPAQRYTPPFIGRAPALDQLARAFKRLEQGRLQLVTVTGAAGIGKTSLIERFISQVLPRDSRLVALSGRCHQYESVPYNGIDAIIDSLSQYLCESPEPVVQRLLPRNAFLLPLSFPVLGRVPSIAASPATFPLMPDAEEIRRHTFIALRELIARLADSTPLILWVDDLQWSDRDTLAFLAFVVGSASPAPLMLIVTARDDDQAPTADHEHVRVLAEHISDLSNSARLRLTRLSPDECDELMLYYGVTGRSAASISRDADGHPLYLLELIRSAHVQHYRHSAATEPAQSLSAMLHHRFLSLTVAQRELVQLVAIAAQPLPAAAFIDAIRFAGYGDPDVIEEPIRNRLVRVADAGSSLRLGMFHDLVRSAVMGVMDEQTRRQRHAQLAAVLRLDTGLDPTILVSHYREAGDIVAAHQAAVKGAHQANGQFAFDRASILYRAAIETLHPQAEMARAELLWRLADALGRAGRGRESATAYLEASACASNQGQRAELQRHAADQMLRSGRIEEALQLLSNLLRATGTFVPQTPFETAVRIVIGRIGIRVRLLWRDTPRAHGHQPDSNRHDRLELLRTGAVVLNTADPLLAAYFQTRYVRDAIRSQDASHRATATALEATFRAATSSRSKDSVMRLLAESERIALRAEASNAVGFTMLARAYVDYLYGAITDGVRDSERAVDYFRTNCTGVAWELTASHVLMLWFKSWSGVFTEISAQASELLRDASIRGDEHLATSVTLLTNLHFTWLAEDRPVECIHMCTHALATSAGAFHRRHYGAMFGLIESLLYMNDSTGAMNALKSHWPRLSSSLMMRWRVARTKVLFLKGRVFLARSCETDSGQDALVEEVARCVKRLKRLDFPWASPMSQSLESGLRLRSGDTGKAIDLMNEARIGFDTAHLDVFARAASCVHGILRADDQGRRQSQEALRALRAQGVRRPELFAKMMLPGAWPITYNA
jgi:serine/threonine protein kinase